MNHDCEHCKYADISSGTRTIRTRNMIITQNGENNIVCENHRLTSINFINNGQMICDSFEPKK